MTTEEQQRAMEIVRDAAKYLNLFARVPAFLREREWPTDDDLVGAVITVVACTAMGAGGTMVHPPPSARFCSGRWPADLGARRADQIVEQMQLEVLTKKA